MKLKIGKAKKIIIIEIFVIIVMIIALISGIKISKLGKENVYKQSVEENIFEVEPDSFYVVDITQTEENVIEKKVETPQEEIDFSSKTLVELKEMAKDKGIKGYSTMKKADLVQSLK